MKLERFVEDCEAIVAARAATRTMPPQDDRWPVRTLVVGKRTRRRGRVLSVDGDKYTIDFGGFNLWRTNWSTLSRNYNRV